MQRFILPALALLAGFAIGSVQDTTTHGSAKEREAVVRGAYEFDSGSFSMSAPGINHPLAFNWVRPDGSGGVLETWLLFRPGEADGWTLPSAASPSLTYTIDYENSIPHGSLANFITWALGELPTALQATAADFEVHEHAVEID
jgi:hypothetical protein